MASSVKHCRGRPWICTIPLREKGSSGIETGVMTEGKKKIRTLFLLLSFIVGVVLVPVCHKANCEDHAAPGDDSHCFVCQVANTPCIVLVAPGAPVPVMLSDGTIPLAIPPAVKDFSLSPTRARAPPAA